MNDVTIEPLAAYGAELGARIAAAQVTPRALIVARHGGAYDGEYYTGPDSLLALGPRLGYSVAAIDRPGYGASAALPAGDLTFDRQTELLTAAVGA
ncbi:hypothetical protein [Tsukamurella paurometabola]|uniref:Alpha/beta hydrolase n=1 Tax=Tsukamurella paurometabola TaxID=2061 RepID=A0ABS5NG86_TSUPA|nr:hypothetical protein [Tsukamurella paurometabola]MBS4103288.1 hypothetical protein [Tsukamurella paurometabola]